MDTEIQQNGEIRRNEQILRILQPSKKESWRNKKPK